MSAIITVDNLGKQYALSGTGAPASATLRESLADAARRLFSRAPASAQKEAARSFWALRNVSFDVAEGEVVGIVGRNGAGKSTLLKVLSRITAPSEGMARIRGRVGSLLEVGTGFHPELSGRENIYFNGAILGLRKHEIRARFDEIVEFSGVGDFLDIPIKRYSSGMKTRLAFSVAAHLEPEIMIVDEVLSVGDAEFQRKCLGKIKDVASSGRTVLFVSHNMNTVRQLCNRVILLSGGKIQLDTYDVGSAIDTYAVAATLTRRWQQSMPVSTEFFTLNAFHSFSDNVESPRINFGNADSIGIFIDVHVHRYVPLLNFGVQLSDSSGNELFFSLSTDGAEKDWPIQGAGRHKLFAYLPSRFLNAGEYTARFIASLHNERWLLDPETSEVVINFTVEQNSLISPYWRMRRPGLLAPELDWRAI